MPPPAKSAFSLVELSIVLVILGLLVGGVLSGRSLIRASELRSITTQFQQFMAAHNSFREKYFAIPGDMVNATSFWGAASAVSATACSVALEAGVSGTETCNGTGNSLVDSAGQANAEIVLYWQHLSNAKLIEGKYTGFSHVGASCCFISSDNSARGKFKNSIWVPQSSNPTLPALASLVGFNYSFGLQQAPWGGMPANASVDNILKAEELWNIDLKMDDGKPNIGKVRAWWSGANDCTTAAQTVPTGEYILTGTSIACYPKFYTGGR